MSAQANKYCMSAQANIAVFAPTEIAAAARLLCHFSSVRRLTDQTSTDPAAIRDA
ncbi:hypothetical protein [Mycolicibacterium moriokaense]|uniref:hypothetical protein n=1 Tax=Mycolicibacterium moriokaense TaxID=39691 RepID=UPI0015E8AB98|nr:hypothetical protein [Mycolicibacterium moriokaense]